MRKWPASPAAALSSASSSSPSCVHRRLSVPLWLLGLGGLIIVGLLLLVPAVLVHMMRDHQGAGAGPAVTANKLAATGFVQQRLAVRGHGPGGGLPSMAEASTVSRAGEAEDENEAVWLERQAWAARVKRAVRRDRELGEQRTERRRPWPLASAPTTIKTAVAAPPAVVSVMSSPAVSVQQLAQLTKRYTTATLSPASPALPFNVTKDVLRDAVALLESSTRSSPSSAAHTSDLVSSASSMPLRVTTFNLWNTNEPWRERRRRIVSTWRSIAVDVVALQEVRQSAQRRPGRERQRQRRPGPVSDDDQDASAFFNHQAEELAHELNAKDEDEGVEGPLRPRPWSFVYVPVYDGADAAVHSRHQQRGRTEGLALITRHDIVNSTSVLLTPRFETFWAQTPQQPQSGAGAGRKRVRRPFTGIPRRALAVLIRLRRPSADASSSAPLYVRVFVVHLTYQDRRQCGMMLKLHRFVRSQDGGTRIPSIVLGDFNAYFDYEWPMALLTRPPASAASLASATSRDPCRAWLRRHLASEDDSEASAGVSDDVDDADDASDDVTIAAALGQWRRDTDTDIDTGAVSRRSSLYVDAWYAPRTADGSVAADTIPAPRLRDGGLTWHNRLDSPVDAVVRGHALMPPVAMLRSYKVCELVAAPKAATTTAATTVVKAGKPFSAGLPTPAARPREQCTWLDDVTVMQSVDEARPDRILIPRASLFRPSAVAGGQSGGGGLEVRFAFVYGQHPFRYREETLDDADTAAGVTAAKLDGSYNGAAAAGGTTDGRGRSGDFSSWRYAYLSDHLGVAVALTVHAAL